MHTDFASIAFTPAVRSLQSQMGSRGAYSRYDGTNETTAADAVLRGGAGFSANEVDFIRERDTFFLATVGETGWPYVQHKGGPAGFVKVLDPRTIAYADYRGNRQYVSDGNLMTNDRVSLLLIDFIEQRRLKIFGRARLEEVGDDPALLAALHNPRYRAKVERAVIIDVAAWDWNCPQHITPRFTREQWEAVSSTELTPP